MNNTVTINNQALNLRQYKGQAVVTFKDIDLVHKRANGTASRNFRTNKQHFIENEDFSLLNHRIFRTTKFVTPKLITEEQFLLLKAATLC